MSFQRSLVSAVVLSAICFIAVGCGDLKKAKTTVKKSTSKLKQDLKDLEQRGKVDPMVYKKLDGIYKAYDAFEKANGKGPANWQDLKAGARLANVDTWPIDEAKKEGYTVVWNGNLKNLSDSDQWCLLAYDSKAPLNGGWVMLANKTMEKMSSADFAEFKPLESK